MVLESRKGGENNDRGESPTWLLLPRRRGPCWVFRTLPVIHFRRPRQQSHELLLFVSCWIHCLYISCSFFQLFSSLHVIILIISFCTLLLCRIKIMECKRTSIFSVGFIDLDKIHVKTLTTKPEETQENLLRFLTEQHFCDHILFPYNFRWGSYYVVHIHFFLLDVKCNWWVTDVYINVCSFHWILMDIQLDKGRVEVMDPLKRPLEMFRDMQDMLQR